MDIWGSADSFHFNYFPWEGDGEIVVRVFLVPTLLAAVWTPLAWHLAPTFLFFAGTILVPWLFFIPLAVLSSNAGLGGWLATQGLFANRRSDEEYRELGPLVDGTCDAWWLKKH